jgi:hypothetical protein
MSKIFLNLSDKDIMKNKYTPQQIEYSIINNNLSLRILSRYQILTPYICAKYVIFGGKNELYGDCTEDRWLDDYDIIKRQPHITKDQLKAAHLFVLNEEKRELKEIISMSNEDRKILQKTVYHNSCWFEYI